MRVVLIVDELLHDIATVSHLEVAQIADIDLRYRSEAGTDKTDEIIRCIRAAIVNLVALCNRFRLTVSTEEVDNALNIPERFVLDFGTTERRTSGKEQAICDVMHNIVVDNALVKFYSNVQQIDLSNNHALPLQESINIFQQLIFSKNPPLI